MRGPTVVTAISNAGRSQDRTRLLVRAFASLPSVPCITAPARSRWAWAAPSLAVHSGDAPENVKHFVRKIRSRVDLLTLPEGGTCPIRTIGARSLRLKERTSAQEWDHALPEAFDDDFLRRRAGVAERGPGRPDAGCPVLQNAFANPGITAALNAAPSVARPHTQPRRPGLPGRDGF